MAMKKQNDDCTDVYTTVLNPGATRFHRVNKLCVKCILKGPLGVPQGQDRREGKPTISPYTIVVTTEIKHIGRLNPQPPRTKKPNRRRYPLRPTPGEAQASEASPAPIPYGDYYY